MLAAERKTALLNAMQKLEAYRQIQNEMGRAVAAFNFRQADRLLSFFALDKADVSLEYADEGVFNGPEAVKAIVNDVVGKEPKPGEMLDMQLEGDLAGSLAIQLAAIPVIDKLFCEVNPIPVKAALNQLGFQVGPLRMPLTEMEPEHQAQLKQAMIDFGIEVK